MVGALQLLCELAVWSLVTQIAGMRKAKQARGKLAGMESYRLDPAACRIKDRLHSSPIRSTRHSIKVTRRVSLDV